MALDEFDSRTSAPAQTQHSQPRPHGYAAPAPPKPSLPVQHSYSARPVTAEPSHTEPAIMQLAKKYLDPPKGISLKRAAQIDEMASKLAVMGSEYDPHGKFISPAQKSAEEAQWVHQAKSMNLTSAESAYLNTRNELHAQAVEAKQNGGLSGSIGRNINAIVNIPEAIGQAGVAAVDLGKQNYQLIAHGKMPKFSKTGTDVLAVAGVIPGIGRFGKVGEDLTRAGADLSRGAKAADAISSTLADGEKSSRLDKAIAGTAADSAESKRLLGSIDSKINDLKTKLGSAGGSYQKDLNTQIYDLETDRAMVKKIDSTLDKLNAARDNPASLGMSKKELKQTITSLQDDRKMMHEGLINPKNVEIPQLQEGGAMHGPQTDTESLQAKVRTKTKNLAGRLKPHMGGNTDDFFTPEPKGASLAARAADAGRRAKGAIPGLDLNPVKDGLAARGSALASHGAEAGSRVKGAVLTGAGALKDKLTILTSNGEAKVSDLQQLKAKLAAIENEKSQLKSAMSTGELDDQFVVKANHSLNTRMGMLKKSARDLGYDLNSEGNGFDKIASSGSDSSAVSAEVPKPAASAQQLKDLHKKLSDYHAYQKELSGKMASGEFDEAEAITGQNSLNGVKGTLEKEAKKYGLTLNKDETGFVQASGATAAETGQLDKLLGITKLRQTGAYTEEELARIKKTRLIELGVIGGGAAIAGGVSAALDPSQPPASGTAKSEPRSAAPAADVIGRYVSGQPDRTNHAYKYHGATAGDNPKGSQKETSADLVSQTRLAGGGVKDTFKDGVVITHDASGKITGRDHVPTGEADKLHTTLKISPEPEKPDNIPAIGKFTSDVGSDIGKHPSQPASIVPDWHAPDEKAELAGLTTSAGSSPYVLEERAGASGATIFRMSDGTFKSYDPSRPAGDIVKSAGTWNTANWKPEISSTVSSVDGQGNVVTGASPPVVPGTVTPAPDAVDRYVSGPANQADSVPPAPSQPAVPAWHADPGWTAPSSETASLAGLSTANNGSAYVIEQRPGASGATIFRMSDGTYKSYDPSRPASDVVKSAGTWDNSTWASGQQTPIEVKPVPVAPQPSAEPTPTHDTAPAPAAPIAASSTPTPAPAAAYVDPVPQRPSVSAADSLSNLGVDSSVGHMVGRGQMRAL